MSDEKINKDFRKLSIDSFFDAEANHLQIAHSQVQLIHSTGDIAACGNHFEVAVRDFFRNKLPGKYYISNGHIIDTSLRASPQLDFIIADNFKTPILYKTLDKTEYLTYESIFAYAEIKSSWLQKYIDEFVITRERIDKFLSRDNVSPNFIDIGGKGAELDIPTTSNSYKNPLFSFMFIGDSDSFNLKHIQSLIKDTNWKYLPNIICLFDRGIIVNINKAKLNDGIFKINLYPEFVDKENNNWVFLSYEKKRSTLGTLYYILLEHLNTCVLSHANMLNYMQQIFEIKPENIDFINDY